MNTEQIKRLTQIARELHAHGDFYHRRRLTDHATEIFDMLESFCGLIPDRPG